MTPSDLPSRSTLPAELRHRLPPSRGPALDCTCLGVGLDGQSSGETCVVLLAEQVLLFSRSSEFIPFQSVPLAASRIPRLVQEGEGVLFVWPVSGGEEVRLPVGPAELEPLFGLLKRLGQLWPTWSQEAASRGGIEDDAVMTSAAKEGVADPGSDDDDADGPTTVWEDGVGPEDSLSHEEAATALGMVPGLFLPGERVGPRPAVEAELPEVVVFLPEAKAPESEKAAPASVVLPEAFLTYPPGEDDSDIPIDVEGSAAGEASPRVSSGPAARGPMAAPDAGLDLPVGRIQDEDPSIRMEGPFAQASPAEAEDEGEASGLITIDIEPAEEPEPEPEPAATRPAEEVVVSSVTAPGPGASTGVLAGPPAAAPAAEPARGRKTIFSGEDLHRRFQQHIQTEENLDAAFCVADALVFMGKAREGVRLFYEHHRPRAQPRTDRVITERIWRSTIQMPGDDEDLDALFALLAPPIARATARKPLSYGLRDEDRRDPNSDLLQISRVFAYAAQALTIGPADLYVQPHRSLGFLFANTTGVLSFVAGADLLKGRHQNELTFLVARQLTLVKPQYFLSNLLPSPGQLRQVLLAAVKLSLPKMKVPPADAEPVEAVHKLLAKQLSSSARKQQALLVSHIVERAGGVVDLDGWFARAQLTADRVGLLLCQDLSQAAGVIKESVRLPGGPSSGQRLQELVRYCLSPEYAEVRRMLGLTINPK